MDDRKRVQKAVYLGQAAGVSLGYHFSWYLMGPYSTPLARDYYQLSEQLDARANFGAGTELKHPIQERLNALDPVLDPPGDIGLDQADWLELLASYHFLRVRSALTESSTLGQLRKEKPSLVKFAARAEAALKEYELLPA